MTGAEILELIGIGIAIILVCIAFIRISEPKDTRYTKEDWKADRRARRIAKKQLKQWKKEHKDDEE